MPSRIDADQPPLPASAAPDRARSPSSAAPARATPTTSAAPATPPASAAPADTPAALANPRRWLILFVVLCAECMDLLDGTVVNVAAPSIHSTLGTSASALQWIISGYPLALAVGLLVGGRLGDILGRRRLFLVGIAGFTVASAICGIAPDTPVLIGARLLQGLTGALMLPQGFGLLRESFPKDELPKVFGFFGPVMGSAAMVGPILGGALVSADLFHDAWRPVFLINVPIGIVAALAAVRLLPRSTVRHAGRLDLRGALIASVASAALIYPLIQGRELGWPAWIDGLIAASIVLFAAFAFHIRRVEEPLVLPSVFGHRGYSAGSLVLLLFMGAMIGVMLALTLFLQVGERFSAIHAGLTLIPFSLGTALAAPLAAGLLPRLGGRLTLQIGAAVSLLGYVATALIITDAGWISSWGLLAPLGVIGLGMGFFVVSGFNTIMAAVSDAELGSASGALNAIQQLGSAIGVAVLGTIFFSVLADRGFHPALGHVLWWAAGALVLVLGASTLLPREARPESELLD